MRLAENSTLREVLSYLRFKGWFQGLSDLEAYRLVLNYQRDKELSLSLHYQGEALKASRPYILELIKLAYLTDSPFKVEDFQEFKERLLATGNIADQQEHELAIHEISKRLLKKGKKAALVSDKDLQFQCIEWKKLNPSGWIGDQNPTQPKIIVDLNLLGTVQNPDTGERIRFTTAPELIHLNSVLGFPYYISVLFANGEGEPFKNALATIDLSLLACQGNTPIQLAAPVNGEDSSEQLFISLKPYMRISPDAIILSRENVLAFERPNDKNEQKPEHTPEPAKKPSKLDRQISAFWDWVERNGGADAVKNKYNTKAEIYAELRKVSLDFGAKDESLNQTFWKKIDFSFEGKGRPTKKGG